MKEELKEATKGLDLKETINYLIKLGYLDKDLCPIKCTMCDSKNLKETNYEIGGYNIPEGVICEFDVVCKECGQVNGHWSYGGWTF